MNRFTALSGVGVVALALVFGLAGTGLLRPARAAEEKAGAGAPLLRAAVVDLEKVLQDSEQWADREEEMSLMRDKMRRALSEYETQLKVLRNDYENLPPDTPKLREMAVQIERTGLQYQQAKLSFERQLEAARSKHLGSIFAKVHEVVDAYARENNIDIVLKRRNMVSARPQEVNMFMVSDVLFAQEKFDITAAVVERLNAQYPGEIKEK